MYRDRLTLTEPRRPAHTPAATATSDPGEYPGTRTRDELVEIARDLLAAVDRASSAGDAFPTDRYGLAWAALVRELRELCARHGLPLPAGLVTGEPSSPGYPYGAIA